MSEPTPIGRRLFPPRFLIFLAVAAISLPGAIVWQGWASGTMIGFDVAALVFLAISAPLLSETNADQIRRSARRNDANREMLLGISAFTTIAVLAAVAAELGGSGRPEAVKVALVIATLALSWTFGNAVFALHYAHLFYLEGDGKKDAGGLDVPGTDEPVYWDFLYFAFTLGMTFQTSDVEIRTVQLRRVAIAHSVLAFVFNLGVVAFTINVLGGG